MKRYGDTVILNKAMEKLLPILKDNFDDWEEIYAMALTRIYRYVPSKKIKIKWKKLYNPLGINPNLDPKNLSRLLMLIGTDKRARNNVYRALSKNLNT